MARGTVLLAEADPLRGLVLASQVTALEYRLVGPAATPDETLALARRESAVDVAVVNAAVGGDVSADTAEAVFRTARVPLVLLVPFDAAPERSPYLSAFHVLTHPVSIEDLESAITAARLRFEAWCDGERKIAPLAEAEIVSRATSAVMRAHDLAAEAAERWLRSECEARREPLVETARAVLIADGMERSGIRR